MKQILEKLQIDCLEPFQFSWRGRRYHLSQVLEKWQYRVKWWLTPNLRGETRKYARVCCQVVPPGHKRPPRGSAAQEKVFELFQRDQDWMLSRVVD